MCLRYKKNSYPEINFLSVFFFFWFIFVCLFVYLNYKTCNHFFYTLFSKYTYKIRFFSVSIQKKNKRTGGKLLCFSIFHTKWKVKKNLPKHIKKKLPICSKKKNFGAHSMKTFLSNWLSSSPRCAMDRFELY